VSFCILVDAANFERLAEAETDPAVKAQLLKQAAAYWKMAEKRAKALGLPEPPKPSHPA
jgi:hypothetical protein